MPGASFHSFYWATEAATVPDPPLGASASGGYIPWMTTITVGCLALMAARASWAPMR